MENIEKIISTRDQSTIATEINIIKDHTNKVLLTSAVEIGKRLKEAKQLIGHGNWSNWLEEEVSYSQRTAQNLMRLYEEYNDKMIEGEIRNSLADLGYTQAIAMLKLDEELREDFMIEHNVSEMSTKDLEAAINERNAIEKEKVDIEKELEKQMSENSSINIQLQEKIKKIKEIETTINSKSDEIKTLQNKLNKVKSADPDVQKNLEIEVAEKRKEIDELRKELKKKPKQIEVEVEKKIEVIPDSIKLELASLQSQVQKAQAKAKATEGSVEFKATFNLLVNLFNQLLDNLEKIKSDSIDEYEKYKNAVNELLKKLVITG